jgi:probable HAF family extracellular repeat protein
MGITLKSCSIFICLLLVMSGLFTTKALAQKYDVILLGSLGGGDTNPYGINDKGEVVGYSYTVGQLVWQAFLWKNGVMSDLGPGGNESIAYRINELGQAVGFYNSLDRTVRHAYLWHDGLKIDLDQSGGKNSIAAAINDSGVVVGSFQDTTSKEIHTFRWENGVFTDMGKLGGEGFSGALGINNKGQMIGNYDRWDIIDSIQSKYVHGFFYENGGATDMGKLVYPEEINDSGQATGYYYPDVNQTTYHSFIWKNGSMTDIGALGTGHTQAHGINDSGHVVGWSYNQGGRDVAFIWKDGVMTDLNTLIDQNSGWVLRVAYAINNHGQIVGIGDFAGLPRFAFLLTPPPLTVTKPAAGTKWYAGEVDTIRWKNGPSGGVNIFFSKDGGTSYTSIAQNVVSDSGTYDWTVPHKRTTSARIVVASATDPSSNDTSDAFSIEDFSITRPLSGQRWISGQRDTVRWIHGAKGEFLNISLSKDSGSTYTLIGGNIPADSGYYSWSIPESTLSVDCFIKLTLASDPSVDTTSRRFRIKGYQLTRFTPSGKYEAFSPSIHGWQYLNGTLWPTFWWSQFQYTTAIDPNTNSTYPPFFHTTAASAFVDWPLWTRVFSPDSCYWSTFLGFYRQRAEDKWKSHALPHNGSCFGFAASSFLAFNFKSLLLFRHPGIHDFTNLATVPFSDSIRQAINSYYTYQFGTLSYQNDAIGQPKDVRTTLQEIRTMFITDATNIQTITIYNNGGGGGGAHTMAPYKLSKDNSGPSRYRLLLYDSNNPLVNTPYILIDSLNNTWTDKTGLGASWAGSNHFYLEIPIINYYFLPAMGKASPRITDEIKASANIEFYNTSKANVVYSGSGGKKISLVNGEFTSEISSAVAIFNKDGSVSDPIGYYVPDDAYSITLSDFAEPGGPVYLTAFKGNIVYSYERNGAAASQVDRFQVDSALSVVSADPAGKTVNLHLVIDRPGDERIFFMRNIPMQMNDSLRLREVGEDRFTIENFGGAKSYDFEIDGRSASKQDASVHLAIPIGGNSRQIIEPDWANLAVGAVNILIDTGNDGTIDDTITVSNQLENIHFRSSWNMVSIPRTLPDYQKSTLFPSAVSAAYAYTPLGYAVQETLRNGQGYWLKFSSGQSIPVIGALRTSDTISLNPGWNMIGSISSPIPVAGIASIPDGIVTSSFFGYDSAYSSADSIRPGHGYWVKVNQSGQLLLSTSAASPSSRIRIVPTAERPPVPPGGEIQNPSPTKAGQIPTQFALDQNFPNPFNPRTTITYDLPKTSYVTLTVYDIFGREVATLVDGTQDPGIKSAEWNAAGVASGVYFYKLQAADFVATKKLLLIK